MVDRNLTMDVRRFPLMTSLLSVSLISVSNDVFRRQQSKIASSDHFLSILSSPIFYVYFIKMPALKKKQRASRRPANMGPSSDQEKFISLDSSRFHCDVRGQKHCAQTFFQIRSRSILSFRLSLSFGFDDFLDIRSKFSRRQSDRSMPTSPFPKYQKVVTHS